MTRAIFLLGLLLLAGCGAKARLQPAPGVALPPQPATSPIRPNADQLLLPPAAERPGRSDELLTKSQERPEDRFELPPH